MRGAKASAEKQRAAALAAYYENPNHCKFCGKRIEVKENERVCFIRKREFCNNSCTQHYRWSRTERTPKPPKEKMVNPETGKSIRPNRMVRALERYNQNPLMCQHCGAKIEATEERPPSKIKGHKYCTPTCFENAMRKRWAKGSADFDPSTVAEKALVHTVIFKMKKDIDKKSIWRFARRTYESKYSSQTCENCGENQVPGDIAHVDAIDSFSPETQVFVINQIRNLICLCPNCHRRFDLGLLEKAGIKEKVAIREDKRLSQS
jgi:hypothetical protein